MIFLRLFLLYVVGSSSNLTSLTYIVLLMEIDSSVIFFMIICKENIADFSALSTRCYRQSILACNLSSVRIVKMCYINTMEYYSFGNLFSFLFYGLLLPLINFIENISKKKKKKGKLLNPVKRKLDSPEAVRQGGWQGRKGYSWHIKINI